MIGYDGTPLTPEQLAYHASWKPSSGHPGGWRVTRERFAGRGLEELNDKRGRLILFRTFDGAKRRAESMNR